MMSYAGNGRGAFQAVTTYKYVGEGCGDYNEVMVPTRYAPNYCWCYAGLAALGALAALAAVLYLRGQQPATTTQPPLLDGSLMPGTTATTTTVRRTDYDCDSGFEEWRTSWSTGKQAFCCDEYGRGCGPSRDRPPILDGNYGLFPPPPDGNMPPPLPDGNMPPPPPDGNMPPPVPN